MNRESNTYTIIYASVMVVFVAVLLAFTSESLKSFQKKNEANDKRRQILRSINVSASAAETEKKYNELIKEAFIVNASGQKVNGDAFAVDAAKMFADKTYPVFVAQVEGKTKYIMAMYGAGLWGPVWGYLAVNDDGITVFGTDFSHMGETPGLGAEIATPAFSSLFSGKQLFKNGVFKSVAIVKRGKTVQGQDYVDGISGGTITSVGVDNMIRHSLECYVEFLKTIK
jgi:Na+-transporting NADH:ubiquinone oxidoreductase subunit C